MPKINFPIVGTFNKVKQKGINPETTYNMYLINQGDDKVPDTLINVPGFKLKFGFDAGIDGRCEFVYQNTIFVVISQYLYKLTSSLFPVEIGQLTTETGYVEMDGNNGDQVMIVDGAHGYIYNVSTNTFEIISDSNMLPNPQSVAFLDGRFIINSAGTNQFQLSDLNDGTSWDALNVQSMQTDWDTIQSVAVNHRILFLYGTQITECWNDVGNPDFPFARLDTMNFQIGTAARGSVVQSEGLLFWLGRSYNGTSSIMLSAGGMPKPISTVDVDQEINNYIHPEDAIAFYFRENGYTFYQINFTSDNQTWLYNVTNSTWTKLRMKDGSRHKLQAVVSYGELNYALAYNDANFYELSQDFVTYNGDTIVKERITHRFFDRSLRDMRVSYVEVDCLHGFSPQQGPPDALNPSATPQIELSISRDAGITFGKPSNSPIGKVGERNKRTYWHNMGINKDFVFRFVCYADIAYYLRDMSILYSVVGPKGRE